MLLYNVFLSRDTRRLMTIASIVPDRPGMVRAAGDPERFWA
jgi:hypothetical protein